MIKLFISPEALSSLYAWSVGSIDIAGSGVNGWSAVKIMTAFVVFGVAVLMLMSRKLNVVSTGDETAKTMGVDAGTVRIIALLVVSMLTASIVSFTGLIGFIGLVCPHIARIFVGSDNRYLIPASAAFGAALLTVADIIGKTIIYPTTIQVGVITAFIGGPLFLYLIVRQKKRPGDMMSENCRNIIDVENVSFGYGRDQPVIRDISFSIERPEFICIVGPNGVGKSTLIKCINGLIKPTEGSIRIFGKEIDEYEPKELAKVAGYVPVMTTEYNSMTVLDAVLVGRYARQSYRTTHKDIMVANKALEAFEVEDLSMKRFSELSAGQHQKVSIARGLVQEPRILVLDEPTSNLDVRHQVYVMAFLKKLSAASGLTVLMISHDLNLAAKFADRIILMAEPGIIRSIGTPEKVLTEKNIEEVYRVSCRVIDDGGSPHIILQYIA